MCLFAQKKQKWPMPQTARWPLRVHKRHWVASDGLLLQTKIKESDTPSASLVSSWTLEEIERTRYSCMCMSGSTCSVIWASGLCFVNVMEKRPKGVHPGLELHLYR